MVSVALAAAGAAAAAAAAAGAVGLVIATAAPQAVAVAAVAGTGGGGIGRWCLGCAAGAVRVPAVDLSTLRRLWRRRSLVRSAALAAQEATGVTAEIARRLGRRRNRRQRWRRRLRRHRWFRRRGRNIGVWLADGSQGQVASCIFELGRGGEGGLGATRSEDAEPVNSGAAGLSVSVYSAP